jgi:hypothetical protein
VKHRKHSSGAAWSSEDDARLRRAWHTETRDGILALFPDRNWNAIGLHAASLGLPFGPPQGYEFVTVAARKCGYYLPTFRKLLARHGVPVRNHTRKAPTGHWKARDHREIVEWSLALQAVDADHETEVVAAAARMRGIPQLTFRKWALAEGLIETKRQGVRQRLPTAVCDAIVERHRPKGPPCPASPEAHPASASVSNSPNPFAPTFTASAMNRARTPTPR